MPSVRGVGFGQHYPPAGATQCSLPAGEKFDAEEISRKTRRPAVVPAQPGSGGDSDKSSRRVLRLSRSYRDVDLRSTLNSGHRRQEGHREPRES